MEDLALVGVHDDGEHLLLAGPGGLRFRLRVDEALRAAVRRDRARLGQIQIEADGRMRPREIQARIRAGESAEQVAGAAGLDLEHVRRYEGPVLAERRYVAEQARALRLRGPVPAGGATLDEVVHERLTERGADADRARWDAWRGDDSTWTVQLELTPGPDGEPLVAHWSYDPALRHLTAVDGMARTLSGESTGSSSPAPAAQPQRRLAPVRETTEADPDAGALELLDSLRERRGRRTRPQAGTDTPHDPVREAIDTMLARGDATVANRRQHEGGAAAGRPAAADPGVVAAPDRPAQDEADGLEALERLGRRDDSPAETPATASPSTRRKGEVLVLPDAGERGPAEDAADEDGDAVTAGGRRTSSSSRKQRRASVPSWDDIVFGQRRD